jgi:flagellar hook-basal body complex protein FliE
MPRLTIAALAAALASSLCLACGSPSRRQETPAAAEAARPESERTEAFKAVEDLSAAIDEARQAVGSASSGTTAAAGEQQLRVSDVRRALVAANVALQKSREALSRDDYAAVRQATLGVPEHLRGVLAKMNR